MLNCHKLPRAAGMAYFRRKGLQNNILVRLCYLYNTKGLCALEKGPVFWAFTVEGCPTDIY